jgi:hypothetical protein
MGVGWLELIISNLIGATIAVAMSRHFAKRSSDELRAETNRLRSLLQDQILQPFSKRVNLSERGALSIQSVQKA